MISIRSFVLYTTIAGLFGTAAYFTVGTVMIQVFYLLMLVNLILMLSMKRLWIPTGLLGFVALLAGSGLVGILRGTDTLPLFAKEFSGIVFSAFYFCCFFRAMSFDLKKCFRLYARMAYWVAIIGIVLFPFRLLLTGEYRLRSILTEPSMFVLTCVPALYYFADQWQRYRANRREFLVMLAAFILAGSSNGFLAILFGMVIFFMRYRRARFVMPGIVIIAGLSFYALFQDVELRVNDSFRALQEFDLSGTNLSTWALFSNMFVAQQVLIEHPILGNGLGSHGLSYEKYIGQVQGVDEFMGSVGEGLNAADANSLATRVLSDMGTMGGLFVVWFLWKYRPRGDSDFEMMSKAIWVYFFVKLLRGGQYFSNEQYFFIVLYVLNRLAVLRPGFLQRPITARHFPIKALHLSSGYSAPS